jgi:hypothetical protein
MKVEKHNCTWVLSFVKKFMPKKDGTIRFEDFVNHMCHELSQKNDSGVTLVQDTFNVQFFYTVDKETYNLIIEAFYHMLYHGFIVPNYNPPDQCNPPKLKPITEFRVTELGECRLKIR